MPETPVAKLTDAAELIRSRRTIHLFKPEKPPREVILRAVDLARWAPNHYLTEPWRFYLLGSETAEAIVRLNAEIVTRRRGEAAGKSKLERWLGIPGWLLVTCRRDDDPVRDRENYAACACAIHNMQLYLWSEGVGMKWTTGRVTRHARFFDLVGVDRAEERVVGLMWYGYPAEVPETLRRPVEEVLTELP